jgi:hypothetical protein
VTDYHGDDNQPCMADNDNINIRADILELLNKEGLFLNNNYNNNIECEKFINGKKMRNKLNRDK